MLNQYLDQYCITTAERHPCCTYVTQLLFLGVITSKKSLRLPVDLTTTMERGEVMLRGKTKAFCHILVNTSTEMSIVSQFVRPDILWIRHLTIWLYLANWRFAFWILTVGIFFLWMHSNHSQIVIFRHSITVSIFGDILVELTITEAKIQITPPIVRLGEVPCLTCCSLDTFAKEHNHHGRGNKVWSKVFLASVSLKQCRFISIGPSWNIIKGKVKSMHAWRYSSSCAKSRYTRTQS